jgi:hypothetical protein
MGALNMAIVSVHRITATGDRIVLDQEYKNIINNLNLGNIEDDPEIRELYKDLMEVIGNRALRGEEAKRFTQKYDALEKDRFVNMLGAARSAAGNPWGFLGGILLNQATAYFGVERSNGLRANMDSELWKLQSGDVEEAMNLQKRLLDSSWSILRRYGLPDEYRLTQLDLDDLDRALSEREGERALRMFRALEPGFKVYAPFWYHYGVAALKTGDIETSRRCFDEFERVWRPVLRQDPYRAEVAKYRARELSASCAPKGKIIEQLKIIVDNSSRENWVNNLFAGTMYYSLGEPERGIERVSVNVDFGVESEISGPTLRNMKAGKLDIELFSDDVQSILVALRRGDGTFAAGGATAERGLIAWFRGDFASAAKLMGESAGETRDPLPYHVLLNMAAARLPGAPALPDEVSLRKERDALSAASYAALLPIVERYVASGNARAKIFLGDMNMKGMGVSRDLGQALELFSGPADAGDAYAQAALGEILETADVLMDEARAVGYYRLAAERGVSRAQLRLGDMCRDGRGAEKNLEDAYMWYYLAHLNGDETAKSRLDELEGKGILRGKSVSGATANRAKERAQQLYEASGTAN